MPPLQFETPPPASHGRRSPDFAAERKELIARTGEWAVICTGGVPYCNSLAGRIRRGEGVWAGHTWEATARRQPDRTAKVYARHIAPTEK